LEILDGNGCLVKSKLDIWFAEANAIRDPVERAQAMGDLSYDAETMLARGDTECAIGLFQLLYALGPDDDLLYPAYKIARRNLIQCDAITLVPLSSVVEGLQAQFASLPEKARYLAVAKSLWRTARADYPETRVVVLDLLERAAVQGVLSAQELKFKAEVVTSGI